MDPTPADESARILEMAISAGVNLIDTGDSYANGAGEKIIGETVERLGRRHDVLIATKWTMVSAVPVHRRRPGAVRTQ